MEVFGGQRQACVCRELTKKFEQVNRGSLEMLLRITEVRGKRRLVYGEIEKCDWRVYCSD